MRHLLIRVGILILIAAFSTAVAIAAGRSQLSPPILDMLHLSACDLPCWNSITPGVTPLTAIDTALHNAYPTPRYSVQDLSNSTIAGQYILISDHVSGAQLHLFIYSEKASALVGSIYVGIISNAATGGHLYTGNLIPQSGAPEGVGVHFGEVQAEPTLYYRDRRTILFFRNRTGWSEPLRVSTHTEIAGFRVWDADYVIEPPKYDWQGFGRYASVR